MKTTLLVAIAAVWLVGATLPARAADESKPAQTAQPQLSDDELGNLLIEAVMLKQRGLYDEAEERCKRILAQKPDQPTVKQLVVEIQGMRQRFGSQQQPESKLQKKLSEIIIPTVNFREAALGDVIEFLQQESGKLSADKTVVNFVWQAPEESRLKRVTLSLQKVSLSEVLRYAIHGTGLSYRLDPYAVVIYQPEKSASATPPAEPNVRSQ